MNLYKKLQLRASENKPIRVGIIGAGKFGSMFLAQVVKLPGIHVLGICDLNIVQTKSNLSYIGWAKSLSAANSLM